MPARTDLSKEQLKNLVLSMYKISNFFADKRFTQILKIKSRFSDSLELEQKLIEDLHYQLKDDVDYRFKNQYSEDYGTRDIPVDECALQIAKQFIDLAKQLQEAYEIPTPKKSDQKFTVKRGDTFLQTVFDTFLTDYFIYKFNNELNDVDAYRFKTFELRNINCALSLYLESVRTLTTVTPFKRFEAMLSKLFVDTAYLTNGYPKDILAHDIRSLKHNANRLECRVDGIIVNSQYASSHIIFKDDPVTQKMKTDKGHIFYPM